MDIIDRLIYVIIDIAFIFLVFFIFSNIYWSFEIIVVALLIMIFINLSHTYKKSNLETKALATDLESFKLRIRILLKDELLLRDYSEELFSETWHKDVYNFPFMNHKYILITWQRMIKNWTFDYYLSLTTKIITYMICIYNILFSI